jgi:hypothetical protein
MYAHLLENVLGVEQESTPSTTTTGVGVEQESTLFTPTTGVGVISTNPGVVHHYCYAAVSQHGLLLAIQTPFSDETLRHTHRH